MATIPNVSEERGTWRGVVETVEFVDKSGKTNSVTVSLLRLSEPTGNLADAASKNSGVPAGATVLLAQDESKLFELAAANRAVRVHGILTTKRLPVIEGLGARQPHDPLSARFSSTVLIVNRVETLE